MSTPIDDLWHKIRDFESLPYAHVTATEDLEGLDKKYTKWYSRLLTAFSRVNKTMMPKEECDAKE